METAIKVLLNVEHPEADVLLRFLWRVLARDIKHTKFAILMLHRNCCAWR
jgi:hypothetical protein